MNVAYARLHNQRLASAQFTKPADVVSWLGAVQAQEYPAPDGRSRCACGARPTPPSSAHLRPERS